MTSKEIITRLIDQKLITGEEAYILINDILHSELIQSWKILETRSPSIVDPWTLKYDYSTSTDSGCLSASST